MDGPKVVVFGAQQITSDCLRTLLDRGVEIPKVVTYELPLEPVYGYTLVSEVCEDLGLPCVQPKRIGPDFVNEIKALEPDLILSSYYRKILPRKLIEIPPRGVVNIHPSMLPDYRGRVPTAWAILNGETQTGVTLHYIDHHIDAGDIIAQRQVPIGPETTGFELYKTCMATGVELFDENVDLILDGTAPRRPQPPGGSYYGSLEGLNRIDWTESAARIVNKTRVFAPPYGGVECRHLNKILVVERASHAPREEHIIQQAGRILKVTDDGKLHVSCVDGTVVFEEYALYPPPNAIESEIYLRPGQSIN